MLSIMKLDGIPTLVKRENNTDKFSMYLMLDIKDGRLALLWKYQPHLKRNMERYAKMDEAFSRLCSLTDKGVALSLFWYQIAKDEQAYRGDWEPANKKHIAWEHLASYFEEECYWAAKEICHDRDVVAWEEYLCIARLMIYNPLKLGDMLARYNANKANVASLDTYIKSALRNQIKFEHQVKRFSRWRLLCKKSDRELKEALLFSGVKEPEISQILFAKKYFQKVYLMNKVENPARQTGKKWPDPSAEDFEKSAQCYNIEKAMPHAPHEVSACSVKMNGKQIQDWMEVSIAALQNYPKSILPQFSLDALQDTGVELKSPLQPEVLELQVSTQQFLSAKATNALRQQLEAMKLDVQKNLFLYYGFGLTQKQLADQLKINQSTISRYLAKSTIAFLETLASFAQPQQWVKQYIEQWLKQDYQTPVHSDLIQATLISAVKKIPLRSKEILQLRYGQNMDEIAIADQLGISDTEISAVVARIKQDLHSNLIEEVNKWIKEYIEKWLRSHYQSLAKSILSTLPKPDGNKLGLDETVSLVETYFQGR